MSKKQAAELFVKKRRLKKHNREIKIQKVFMAHQKELMEKLKQQKIELNK